MDLNAYRNQVIASLQQALNRKVAFSNATFSMQIGPAFTFDNVRVMERDGTEEFLVARRIRVHLALFPLLGKKVVLRDVAVESARLRIERDATGKLNITDLLVPKQGAYQLQLRKIALANCDLRWRDFMVQDRVFQADVKIVNLELDGVSPGHKGSVKLDCVFPGRSGASGHAGLSGTVRLSRTGKPPGETDVNLDADFRQLDINQFWPYFERYIPFGRTGGYVDLKCSLKGKAGQFTSKGKLRLSAASVTWPAVFHAPVNPKIAQLEYELKRETDSIDMPDLRFAVDGVRVRGKLPSSGYHFAGPEDHCQGQFGPGCPGTRSSLDTLRNHRQRHVSVHRTAHHRRSVPAGIGRFGRPCQPDSPHGTGNELQCAAHQGNRG